MQIARITQPVEPYFPPGLLRIEYVSPRDDHPDWALALPGRSDTWVVMVHGHGSSGDQLFTRPDIRADWLPLFRSRGLGILTVNLRGNAWMAPAAAADLHALLQFVREQYHARRFIFASGSMGGTSNIVYAVLHPEDVAALIALCPACDLASYHAWCIERRSTPILAEIADAIASAYGGVPADRPDVYAAHSAIARADRLTMPVYIAHGSEDAIIPVEQSRELARRMAARAGFRSEELPGGDHDAPLARMGEGLAWVLERLP